MNVSPKSYVKLITYIKNDNGFDLMVDVAFFISPQIEGLVPETYYFVTSFTFHQGESIPDFHIHFLYANSDIILMKDRLSS